MKFNNSGVLGKTTFGALPCTRRITVGKRPRARIFLAHAKGAPCGERIYALIQQVLAQLMTRAALTVRKQGFMYDIGDRNVMVKDGEFAGIIDQDCVFFGDRLLAPGLAWATLAATHATRNSAFVEHWMELELSQAGPKRKARWASAQLFCAGWIARHECVA